MHTKGTTMSSWLLNFYLETLEIAPAIRTELYELENEIQLRQDGHQSADNCPREIRTEYGGPRTCLICDGFDKMRGHIEAIRSRLASFK
jgi:hypothetical protein